MLQCWFEFDAASTVMFVCSSGLVQLRFSCVMVQWWFTDVVHLGGSWFEHSCMVMVHVVVA